MIEIEKGLGNSSHELMQDHLDRVAALPYHAMQRRAGDETTHIQGPGRAASGRGAIPRRQRTAGTRTMVEDPVGRRTAGAPRTGEAASLETGEASAELTTWGYCQPAQTCRSSVRAWPGGGSGEDGRCADDWLAVRDDRKGAQPGRHRLTHFWPAGSATIPTTNRDLTVIDGGRSAGVPFFPHRTSSLRLDHAQKQR
jgi:hypothetical protein